MEKMKYDEEEDILSFSKGKKIKESVDVGDFIVDLDQKEFVTGVEILNASENLNLPKEQLKDLRNVSMNVAYRPNSVNICLLMKFKEKEKDLTIPLALKLGHDETREMHFAVT